ncbi:hypothetical protein SDC9_130174 [bioreactor metagenome]|uniref:Uncharacterized protein n=1 Tax=bioreactor metagenome TaxID=1076179 RepID=A0A645D1R9_9ZZZZ
MIEVCYLPVGSTFARNSRIFFFDSKTQINVFRILGPENICHFLLESNNFILQFTNLRSAFTFIRIPEKETMRNIIIIFTVDIGKKAVAFFVTCFLHCFDFILCFSFNQSNDFPFDLLNIINKDFCFFLNGKRLVVVFLHFTRR